MILQVQLPVQEELPTEDNGYLNLVKVRKLAGSAHRVVSRHAVPAPKEIPRTVIFACSTNFRKELQGFPPGIVDSIQEPSTSGATFILQALSNSKRSMDIKGGKKGRLIMKKMSLIAALPLVPMLWFGGTLEASPADRSIPGLESTSWVYVSIAECPTARCFDEALWTTLARVADIEAQLPDNLTTITVEIRPLSQVFEPFRMTFARKDLQRLVAGEISPERFLQENVRFS